jgi:23S rRNA (cytidine2498-2'-O)-methyltransferase
VTVKRDEGSDAQRAAKSTQELPAGIFCRTVGWSLGKTRGEESGPLLQELEAILDAAAPEETFDQLHVWPRDRRPVGSMQFEPGPDPLSDAVAETLWQPLSAGGKITAPAANLTAQPGQRVLDVVLVEPNEWWIGWHSVQATPSRWPGSVLPLPSAEPPVSRAYYKLAEALAWSQWDLHPDDMAIEIGSSPGGACQRLLELGLQVIGIDPADMDERILEHPRFTHIRARASDLKRSVYQPARWLVSDASTRPETMLTAIEKIVTHSSSRVEGMLLTCKLRSYERATEIPAWIERVQSFGFPDVQARQLAANRCEITLAAHRPR